MIWKYETLSSLWLENEEHKSTLVTVLDGWTLTSIFYGRDN